MISFGFYDSSLSGDRKYSAMDFNELFDGVIRQGVFMSIGDCFRVLPKDGMTVTLGTGKAWLNKSWIVSDSKLPCRFDLSEVAFDRIDAIFIDIDQRPGYRRNDIKIVKGIPSSAPVRPSTIPNDIDYDDVNPQHFLYPIAYIRIRAGSTTIREADITMMVGSSELPYVTGILKTVDIDSLKSQWQDQWSAFYESQTHKMETDYDKWTKEWDDWYNNQTTEIQNAFDNWGREWKIWFTNYTNEMNSTAKEWDDLWKTWFYSYVNENTQENAQWQEERETEFRNWFTSLNALLEDDVATNLANGIVENSNKINKVENTVNDLITDKAHYKEVKDNTGIESILDETGEPIIGMDFAFLTTNSDFQKITNLPDDSDIIIKTDNQFKGFPSVNLITQYINPLEKAILNNNDNINQIVQKTKYLTSDGIYDWLDTWIPVSVRKNIVRIKKIGSVFTDEQKAVIRDGSFRGMFIGDYWAYHNLRTDEIGRACPEWVNFRLADFDYYKNSGRITTKINKPHVTLVPDGPMGFHPFSDNDTYNNTYLTSFMVSPKGFDHWIGPIVNDFGVLDKNVLVYEGRFTNEIEINLDITIRRLISSYATRWVDLLSEIEVFGYKFASTGPDYEFVPAQISLFRIDPSFIGFSSDYWLRDIAKVKVDPKSNSLGASEVFYPVFVSQYFTSAAPSNNPTSSLAIRPVFHVIG